MRQVVWDSIEECVKESPLEFQTMTDFVRDAIRAELRRRGKIQETIDKALLQMGSEIKNKC